MLAINDKRVNKVKTNSACCANLVKNSGAVSPGGEKMKTVNRFCLYGMVLMGASVAVAEVDRSGLYLNLGVGLQDFDHKRDLDEDTTYLIGGEYRFGKHWATELRYYYTEVDYNKGGKVDVDQYGADGIYYFPMNDGAFEPYLAAGAGYGVFDDGDSDNDEMQLNAGGGLRIYMSERFSLRADVRAIYGEDDDTVDGLASVGVSFFFGAGGEINQQQAEEPDSDGDGVVDSLDQCPNTPQGVEVDASGCPLDADGDGVPDSSDRCLNTPAGSTVNAEGCILARAKEVSFDLSLRFANNSSYLEGYNTAEVEKVINYLQANPGAVAVVEGHTDNTGAAAYNQTLSTRRAATVVKLLTEKYGVDAASITAVGYGEDRPIADNSTAAGRDANRRVVVKVRNTETQPADK